MQIPRGAEGNTESLAWAERENAELQQDPSDTLVNAMGEEHSMWEALAGPAKRNASH